VRRLLPAFLFLLGLARARGDPAVVSVESSADLDATINFRCALSHDELRILCAWQDCASSDGEAETALPTVALSLPWLLFGPVARAGLLREASNPLGFSAGSSVFAERTGVRLDGSLPAGNPGLLCMPVPDVLGIFCLPCPNGARACGCFASLQSRSGFRAEGFVCGSKSRPEHTGEEWFRSRPADPGGAMTATGVRLGADLPGLSLGATLGGSFSERAPPGSFMLLHGSWHGNDWFAEALLGRTDSTYRRPGGEGSEAGSAFSVSAGIEGPARTAKVSYAICLDQPGFAPRQYLASSEVMGIVLEQALAAASGLAAVCRARAERRISRDSQGNRQQTGRCSAALKGKIRGFEAASCVELNEPGGIDLSLTGAFQETGRSPRFSLESRLERLSAGCPVLTLLAALQLERKDVRLSLESGIEGWTVSTTALDAIRHVRLKVSWGTQCTLGK
jgi:hypothetical protein